MTFLTENRIRVPVSVQITPHETFIWNICMHSNNSWTEIPLDVLGSKYFEIINYVKQQQLHSFIKTLFFHSFHSQRKIHKSYSLMLQIFVAYLVCLSRLSMPQIVKCRPLYQWHIQVILVYLPLRLEGTKK